MSWHSSEDASERREAVVRQIAERRARGEGMVKLEAPAGSRKLVRTFWAQAWCQHLEQYSHYETRLPRGRSYLRQGQVYDLTVSPGAIEAVVAGSSLYEVRVMITPLSPEAWQRLKEQCAGEVTSLLDLLAGKLGEGVLQTISNPGGGLFPEPAEIRFTCTCPDYADLCKHAAAVLYGVAVRFDTAAELFFTLRGVDPSELIATRESALSQTLTAEPALANEDLSALFGIDLKEDEQR